MYKVDGAEVGPKAKLAAGELTVTVTARGNAVAEDVSVTVNVGTDIAKTKIKVNNKPFYKTYTGEPIELNTDDFGTGKIEVANSLELDKDFVIVGYKNNIKKGTMTVTIAGIGTYGGTRTFKVKIKAKEIKAAD